MSEKIHEVPRRAGGDKRGNAQQRRSRKQWMLSSDQFKHNPDHPEPNVQCTHCHKPLTYDTVEADRKQPGGSYARHNIQPACRSCNLGRSNNPDWKGPAEQHGS